MGRTSRPRRIWIAGLLIAAACARFGGFRASGQSGPGVPLAETVEAINQARVTTRILYITANGKDDVGGLYSIELTVPGLPAPSVPSVPGPVSNQSPFFCWAAFSQSARVASLL